MRTSPLLLFSALLPTLLCAAEFRFDFESDLPGDVPRSCRPGFGKINDEDLLCVSNMHALAGRHALLIRHRIDAPRQWCYTLSLARVESAQELTIPFRVDEGSNFPLGLEFHTARKPSRFLTANFSRQTVRIGSRAFRELGVAGAFRPRCWYQLVLNLPAPGSGGDTVEFHLDARTADGTWTRGASVTVRSGPLDSPLASLNLVIGGDRKRHGADFTIYFDEIRQRTPEK